MGIGIVVFLLAFIGFVVAKRLHLKKQFMIYIQIMLGAGFLALVSGYVSSSNETFLHNYEVQKTKAGEGEKTKDLQVEIPELETEVPYSLKIPEKKLTSAEIKALFEKSKKQAEKDFLYKNKSLNHVTKKVNLCQSVFDDLVMCNWKIEQDDDIVMSDGTINDGKIPKKGKLLQANVTFTYGESTCDYAFFFQVEKRKLTKSQEVMQEITKKLDGENKEKETLILPKKILGYQIKWSVKKEFHSELLCFLGVITCIGVYYAQKEQNEKRKADRQKELSYSYAEVVSKISLLLSAGMTVRLAWEKIVMTYQNQLSSNKINKQIVYDEMSLSYAKMNEGMSELEVYENFAKNCNHPKYTKLVSLLIQNLKKGQEEFLLLLEQEAKEAFLERKLLAKKLGEEASTKLLLPMMLMLLLVIVILMVPAVFSFQI